MKELQTIVAELSRTDAVAGSVLATLVTVEGSSYRRPGARLLLKPDGTRIGSISGGCLEEDVLARAQGVAKTGQAEVVVYDTTSENDLVFGVGLGCHGVVQVLLERLPARPAWAVAVAENLVRGQPTSLTVRWRHPDAAALGTHLDEVGDRPGRRPGPTTEAVFCDVVKPAPQLIIFGAGDDAQPLLRMVKEFGWRVTVADPRAAFVTRERFPLADNLVSAPAASLVDRVAPEAQALAVIMTHHYVHDLPILRDLLGRPLAYLGVLGPKKRAQKMLEDLSAEGRVPTPEQRARLHTPVGLDLGGDTPETVALSIVAEMQSVLHGRDGKPLRHRTGPIHQP